MVSSCQLLSLVTLQSDWKGLQKFKSRCAKGGKILLGEKFGNFMNNS